MPPVRAADGRELKFNPYHDARDGRFTSGPGGAAAVLQRSVGRSGKPDGRSADLGHADLSASLAATGPEPVMGRGGNARAFEIPMTLEQSFPGLAASPGGAIVAVADNLLDLHGPANAMMAGVYRDQSSQLIAQTKAIDPTWHFDRLGPNDSVEGLAREYNDLRFQHAAVLARVKGDYGPLQVETLRFVQQRADDAYAEGVGLLKAGRLRIRLSEQEGIGNYVDREVREDLRERYSSLGIDSAGKGPVRVNRREDDSSGTDLTYRRPDSRVGDVAFDVTLTRKTLKTAQVRGFFNADFRPSRVVIIRPRQIGVDHTYIINRPESR